MTGPERNKPDSIDARAARLPPHIERRVRIARALLIWQAFWPALWPAAGLAGIFVVLALFGAFTVLPLPLHWAFLAAFGTTMVWTLWRGFRGFKWPTRHDAFRHLEKSSGLRHSPLAAYEDVAAETSGDPALWSAHRRWVTERLRKLRLSLPQPGLASRDPRALRAAVLLLLVVAVIGTGPGRAERIAAALLPGASAVMQATIEAWITPPAYTGEPPLYLDRRGDDTPVAQNVSAPQGSILSLRVHGLRNAPVLESHGDDTREKPQALKTISEGNHSIDAELIETTDLALTEGGRVIRGWRIEVTPDETPRIELSEPLAQSASGALRFAYKVSDDHGVVGAEARIELDRSADPKLEEARSAAEPRVTAPHVQLPLPSLRPRDAAGETYADLTPHPWAGLPVKITLVARDDANQEGAAEPVETVLPARTFTDPLARAIVEQRRRLALDPRSGASVARFIDNFTQDADRYIDDKVVYLSLRAAYWRLTEARRDADLTGIFDLLWSIALRVEDGDISLTERDLRDAQKALADALNQGAGEEEIARLMSELRDAFNRHMDALTASQGPMPDTPPTNNALSDAQTVERQQLEDMLNAIGELAQSGARDQAKAMLQQLQAILENLQLPGQAGPMGPGEQAMAQAIDQMGEMITKQRELMDRTFGETQGGIGEDGADGQTPGAGMPGQTPHGGEAGSMPSLDALAEAQRALRDELGEILKRLGEGGAEVPGALGNAERSMRDAEERLEAGRADRATGAQGQAIDEMRAGAQAMADQLMQGMAGRQEGRGRGQSRSDPLGRPMRQSGQETGADVAVPDKIDMQRAREILEELRRRAADLGRPRIELDYLDRLLQRF
ncbi:MAG: TIGR02302 family protein [Parvibaculum sp.]|uniref:TIGR02302 family protein n=1 Tax=Parvibaculum sp. TaxID=2024848 RepID=UPI00349FF90B